MKCFSKQEDGSWVCSVCLEFMSLPELPKKLKSHIKGNFGFFQQYKKHYDLKTKLKRHRSHRIHLWCLGKAKETRFIEKKNKQNNVAAIKIVVRNVVKNIIDGGGAQAFLRDIDLVQLTLENMDLKYPTKGDGTHNYFIIRNLFFEELHNLAIHRLMLAPPV